MTHFLQIQGGENPCEGGRYAETVAEFSRVSEAAQTLANRTRRPVNACIRIEDSLWPDERLGDWGCFWPR